MAHIHTEAGQYDFTVGAYVVRATEDSYEVLLHAHRKLHKLLPIGGHIELNESPWSAVARELKEEAGYILDDLYILQPKQSIKQLTNITVQPQPLVMASYDVTETHNHTDMAYVFVEKKSPTHAPEEGESLEFHWLSSRQLQNLTIEEVFINTKEIYAHILEHCIGNWEQSEARTYATS
jgi:8-oxo-dGTP pyrophosphatase MutT (NUDIX family)